MKKYIITLNFLFLVLTNSYAQDDMMSLLDKAEEKKKEFVTATFKGTRLINFHTIETTGRRTLDFRIAHRFGDINSGTYNFWGIDGPASIRLSMDYTYDGSLQFGIGRSSYQKMLDGFIKYRLIRQTTDNSNLLSITLVASSFYTTLKDPNRKTVGYDVYQKRVDRMSYCYQIIAARKFSERLSLQLAPTMLHFNLVDSAGQKNDMFALAFAGRYKFSKRCAITAEYCYRITNSFSTQKYYDSAGIGVDIETGGHVFQIHLTNSFGIVENQFIAQTNSSWKNAGIKIGFNISRAFTL